VNSDRWGEVWDRWRLPGIVAAVGGGMIYLWLSILVYLGIRFPNIYLNASFTLYTVGTAFVLLGWANGWKRGVVVDALTRFGQLSLPLFILHPLILDKIRGPTITSVFEATRVAPVALYVVLFCATLAATYFLIWVRLDNILFARNFREEWRIAEERLARAGQA
jgi:hypothetical protein